MIFNNKPETLKNIINDVLDAKGWNDKLDETKIPKIWSEIVGESVSKSIRVIKVEKGVLYLRTNSSTWDAELRLSTETLINRINEKLGKNLITNIKTR